MPGSMSDRLDPPLEEIDHRLGEPGAALELVMYGDFQCPFCLGAQSIVRRVRSRLGDRLLFVFRHLPLVEVHPLAQAAAEASEAAAAQDAFWPYHDALYAAQPRLSERELLAVADALGLDAGRVDAELGDGRHAARVERDRRSAAASGATGTPTFFANGRRHVGAFDAGSLVEALEGR